MKKEEADTHNGWAFNRLLRLRDGWMLLVFVVSAALWVDGTVRTILILPETLGRHSQDLQAIELRLSALEYLVASDRCLGSPCLNRRISSAF
ncbi:MAG: hypothetical protein AAF503_06120 [Pseudomonadota bacterium]